MDDEEEDDYFEAIVGACEDWELGQFYLCESLFSYLSKDATHPKWGIEGSIPSVMDFGEE